MAVWYVYQVYSIFSTFLLQSIYVGREFADFSPAISHRQSRSRLNGALIYTNWQTARSKHYWYIVRIVWGCSWVFNLIMVMTINLISTIVGGLQIFWGFRVLINGVIFGTSKNIPIHSFIQSLAMNIYYFHNLTNNNKIPSYPLVCITSCIASPSRGMPEYIVNKSMKQWLMTVCDGIICAIT